MKTVQPARAMFLAAAVFSVLTACGEPKSQTEVDRDVAQTRSEAAKDMADARSAAMDEVADARQKAQEEIQDANQQTAKAQADLTAAAADAKFKLAMEQAAAEHDVAVEKCEGLTSEMQKSCKDRAHAELAAAEARATEDYANQTRAQY